MNPHNVHVKLKRLLARWGVGRGDVSGEQPSLGLLLLLLCRLLWSLLSLLSVSIPLTVPPSSTAQQAGQQRNTALHHWSRH